MTARVDPVALGRAIRRARLARGLSLRAAAAEMGVPFGRLGAVERGTADGKASEAAIHWIGVRAECIPTYHAGYDDAVRALRGALDEVAGSGSEAAA